MNLKDIIAEQIKEFENWFAPTGIVRAFPEDIKFFLSSSIEKACKEYAKAVVEEATNEIRGSEEQVEASKCGLYHWNDCRQATLKRAEEILKK